MEEDQKNIIQIKEKNKDLMFVYCDFLKDIVKLTNCSNCPNFNKCKNK